MAHFEKRTSAKGVVSWRVQVRRRGVEESKTFRTKVRAKEWALQVEAGITGESRKLGKHTLLDALRRYALEVSPGKRGGAWERVRLTAMEGNEGRPADELVARPMASIGEDHIAAWRDRRLKQVAPATVRREMNLLASVFEIARREWKWIRTNPMREVRKPAEPPARRRGVTDEELRALGERLTGPAGLEVLAAFELAIETGMRAGEMMGLDREQIDLGPGVAHLDMTKNGDARDVALSPRAIEIIRGLLADGRPRLFTIGSGTRDALFRKAREAAGIVDLHFHDSRAEAVKRLSKQFNVLELAEQIGHRDLNSLQLYYRQPASERATRLARAAPRTRRSPRPPPSKGGRRPRSRG